MAEIIPVKAGENWAPLKPLLKLQEGSKAASHPITDALKERFKHYKKMQEEVWREIYSVGQMTALFIEGKQLLMPNPYTGGWRVLKPSREDESTKRAMNLMQFYADNCITKWLSSNPNIRILPGSDTDEAELAARNANCINKHYEEKFYTVEFSIQEGLSALIYGTYLNEYVYDPGVEGPTILKKIFGTQHLRLSEGHGICGDCGFESTGEEFVRGCPQCQSMDVQVEPPTEIDVRTAIGETKEQMGDIVCRPVPLLASRWDLKYRAEESPWRIKMRRVPLTAIKTIMGNVRLPGGDSTDVGLDLLETLANSGQAISGRSIGGQRKKPYEDEVTVCEFWMDVECYGDIELKGDEMSINGQSIPEGHLSDLFPKHLCVVGLNDMEIILGIYDENHKAYFVSGMWHSKANSGVGRGMADTVEVQKRFNTLDSQALAYLQSTATPGILYNQLLMQSDEMQYLGTPNKNFPVDMRQLPEGSRLSDAIWQFKPGSLPGEFMQYNHNFLNHMFQLTSLVTDFTGGLNPVVRNYTATGANISAALANSLFSPILSVKASVRKRGAQLLIPLYRQHFPMERQFAYAGKYGRQQVIALRGVDIDNNLRYIVERGSELPRNVDAEKESFINLVQNLGGGEGYIMFKREFPELMSHLERLWDIDTQDQKYDTITGVCRGRLGQLKALAGAGIEDPTALLQNIQPAISRYEPQQLAQAAWWQDFLLTDEGLAAPPVVRHVAEILVQIHFENTGFQEQAKALQSGMAEAAGMVAPGLLQMVGQQLSAPPPEPEPPAQEPVDPVEEAKGRIKYSDAPKSVQVQMEMDAGFQPAPNAEDRPPLVKAEAALKSAQASMKSAMRPKPAASPKLKVKPKGKK